NGSRAAASSITLAAVLPTAPRTVSPRGIASGKRSTQRVSGALGSASISVVAAPAWTKTNDSASADVVLPTPPLDDANTMVGTGLAPDIRYRLGTRYQSHIG